MRNLFGRLFNRRRRPRIAVLYDYDYWILGGWAKNIALLYGETYDIKTMSMFDLPAKRSFRRWVRDADLVHILLPHPFQDVRKLRPAGPILATIHHWVDWDFVSDVAASSDGIVTGSHPWKTAMAEQGVALSKIDVIHSGIETRYLETVTPLLPPSGKTTFGFFAKMGSNENDRKGIRHFQAVLTEIVRRGVQDRFRVVISGPGWADFVSSLDNSIEVIYREFTSAQDMPALYQSLDIYLMLSDVEGGPVTLAEAMASRCIVFSTNVGVAQDIVADGRTGRIVENSEHAAIVDKLVRFDANSSETQAMRDAAYGVACDMTFSKTLAPLGAIYQRYLGSRPAA